MKNVLVIPGSEAQIAIICKLQNMGFKVICINLYENSPAFEYADISIQGDILDREFCLKVAQDNNVIAVFSDECDIAMPVVAYISDTMGLPSIGQSKASLYTNKFLMRRFLEKRGMPCPRYQKCLSKEEAESFFETLATPKMIMKPLDSNSSRGVFTITEKERIDSLFDEAISFSKVDASVLCEEYIEGTEFTVDGILIDGKHYSLAISKKRHYDYNNNIANELFFSYEDEMYDYGCLRELNNRYVEQSGLPFGLTHAEYKFDGENFVLIEIGARGGGNFISSKIVPYLTGVDIYELLINSMIGNKNVSLKCDVSLMKKRFAVLKFFDIPNKRGKVIAVEGEDLLKKNSSVLLYQFRFRLGDVLQKAENDSARAGFYIAVAETRENLEKLMKEINSTVNIVLESICDC